MSSRTRPLRLEATIQRLTLKAPFRISGYTFTEAEVLRVQLEDGTSSGRGEASGVYYLQDDAPRMLATLEAVRPEIEAGLTRADLRALLPTCGARNALDCALWELEANRARVPAWRLAGLQPPRPLVTTFTVGADDPDLMAAAALDYTHARALKLKLTGDVDLDANRVRAVRAARPEAWMGVDGNQGFSRVSLEKLLPTLIHARVELLEQPLPRGAEEDLVGLGSPIPIAADESLQGLADVPGLVGRFDVANIKLDKCGGLTEALMIADAVRAQGLKVMVGNMIGTSLAMAPAFLVGQGCDVVDLDGPIFLAQDVVPGLTYADGQVSCEPDVWGGRGSGQP